MIGREARSASLHSRRPQKQPARAVPSSGWEMADYVFVDEWDVRAPIESVFDALADARTYPEWWAPVYKQVDADGPPRVGSTSTQRFKGKLRTRSRRNPGSRGSSAHI